MAARLIASRPIASAPMAVAPIASAPTAIGAIACGARSRGPTTRGATSVLRAMVLQHCLELVEGAHVALRHLALHQRRHQLEEPAGLGLHHELHPRPTAVVVQLPPPRGAH